MTQPLIPVILAGGKGERFWPLSRRERPKQFLSLDGSGESLLQATAKRLLPLGQTWDNLWVITAAPIADGVREQLKSLPSSNLLVEPQGKDTAPAIAWTTLEISKRYGKDAVIGFFPADHWIKNTDEFKNTLKAASQLAATEKAIVTLGIKPGYPSTGYGYIEQGKLTHTMENLPVYKVSRFTEKPDLETAKSFIETGRFSWNSGMFIFRAGVVLEELEKYAPQVIKLLQEKGEAAYGELEKNSIDYTLMEKTQLTYVLPASFGWDDLGDWNALERFIEGDGDNTELGNHVTLDSKSNIIYSSNNDDVIATIGLENMVIVRDKNITLVVPKNRTQDIKKLLKEIQSKGQFEKLL